MISPAPRTVGVLLVLGTLEARDHRGGHLAGLDAIGRRPDAVGTAECGAAGKKPAVVGMTYPTKSGIKQWVDPATGAEHQRYVSSRGRPWDLVMSDEFNTPGRSFRPGDDHMWTSIEKPDGVNAAMEFYAHNKTTTACDESTDVCSFQIELEESVVQLQVWNSFLSTPGFENVTFVRTFHILQMTP